MMHPRATRLAAAIAITVSLVVISSSLAAQWIDEMHSHLRGWSHEWVVPPSITIILLCFMSEWLFPPASYPKTWGLRCVARGGLISVSAWLVMMLLVRFYLKASWVEFFPLYGVLFAPIALFFWAPVWAPACLLFRLWFRKLRRNQE